MADFPAMPLFTDAYLADTTHLSVEEHGAYLKLLIVAWRTPECCLPDDDRRLATMLGVTLKKWQKKYRPTIEPFWTVEGGIWRQKKQLKIRQAVQRSVAQKSAAGKQSALAKAKKNNDSGSTAVGSPLDQPDNGQDAAPDSGPESRINDLAVPNDSNPSPLSNRQTETEQTTNLLNINETDSTAVPEPLQRSVQQPKPNKKESYRDSESTIPKNLTHPNLLSPEGDDALLRIFPPVDRLKGSGPNRSYPEQFEQFWQAYPRRATDTRKKAYIAWRQAALTKSVGPQVLMHGCNRYAEYISKSGQEPKLVQSWINAEGWTASLLDVKSGGSSTYDNGRRRPVSISAAFRRLRDQDRQDPPTTDENGGADFSAVGRRRG